MKNINMKIKIFFLMMLFLISLNNVSGVTYENGSLQIESYGESETNYGEDGLNKEITAYTKYMELHYKSFADSGTPNTLEYDTVQFTYTGEYENIPSSVGGPFRIYDGTTEIGRGNLYIFKDTEKSDTVLIARMLYIFEEGFNTSGIDKIYDLRVYTQVIDVYFTTIDCNQEWEDAHPLEYTALNIGISPHPYDGNRHSHGNQYEYVYVTYSKLLDFRNDYSIEISESITITDIFRNFPDKLVSSRIVVRNQDDSLYYQSGYSAINVTYIETFNETRKYYIKPEQDDNEHLIYAYFPPAPPEIPTLTTDKTNYNLSETMTISYTNIDELAAPGKTYTLYILYPVISDYKEYEVKFMQHLYADERDESFTINTSFLLPENEYYLGISEPGAYQRTTDHIIMSDVFYVYDDNEYINTNCNPESNCYTYNGGDISIYYKINNNSDIIIKDNAGNIIQTYYNIIDEGEINYNIPDDLNKLNSYPNWKFYLNNTEYETNYSTDVTIYWSLIAIPTPTPIYTSVPIDENVTEQIDELKEESKPIFDLIYGLSELVVDNPDYDDDNIITENEMNNWFNSLIPIALILLIFIVYTGLSKKR